MDFIISALLPNDKEDWIAMRNQADPWCADNDRPDIPAANWAKIIDPDNPLHGLALRAGDVLAGYALYFFSPCIRTPWDECAMRDIFVLPHFRRQGGGTMLMTAVHEHAETQGAGRMYWATNPEREEAVAFYKHFGDAEQRLETVFIRWLPAAQKKAA